MKTLGVVPIQAEADFLAQAITEEKYQGENAQIGRLMGGAPSVVPGAPWPCGQWRRGYGLRR
jgi:hypothetical protein